MYDPWGRYCPKHPTLVHPCQICGSLTKDVSPEVPDNTRVADVNWQTEALTPYAGPHPKPSRFHPFRKLAAKLGLTDTLDDPVDRVRPPISPSSTLGL